MCVFTKPPAVIVQPGGVSEASAVIKQEQQAVQKQYVNQKKAVKKLKREAVRRRQEAEQADKKRSKKHIAPKDRDAKGKINLAILTGKDGKAGKLYSQLQSRVDRMQEDFDKIRLRRKELLEYGCLDL